MHYKKLKTIRGHTGLARYLATVELTEIEVPRTDIPSPYAYAPTHVTYRDNGQLVIIVESKHMQHDVYAVPADAEILMGPN